MSARRRPVLIVGTIVVILVISGFVSTQRFLSARQAARDAAHDEIECAAIAARIRAMIALPQVVVAETNVGDVNSLINAACQSVGLPTDRILRISTEPARRVREKPYSEQATSIVLRDVSLIQLLSFLHAVSTTNKATLVRSIQLTAPHTPTGSNTWNADVQLVHRVEAPAEENN